jgi:uncharacterized protein
MANRNVKQFSELLKRSRILKKYHIRTIKLFGSFARGEESNDIDIYVENVDNYDSLIDFRNELETLTKKRVDIMIDKYANPIVLYRARKDMVDVSGY